MEQRLLDWLAHYGPVVLVLAQVAGIFGLPIPDELLLTVSNLWDGNILPEMNRKVRSF